jgi:hypothetical protein
MFKRKTLFIIGAGASAEVDLPVGAELAKAISRMLDVHPAGVKNPTGEMLLAQLYDKHPIAHNGYHRAAMLISDGVRLANSIDDFLDRHSGNEPVQLVGKIAIVKSIIDAERASFLSRYPRSSTLLDVLATTWYMKFFRMLGSGIHVSNARQIFDNVAFIVFNYDRCLEFFLTNALQQVYNVSQAEAESIVDDLHIIHPYGVVADLPLNGSGAPFGGIDKFDHDYVALSAGVKIFTEQIGAADMLSQIRQEMFVSEQIVFLGFGYHEPNMRMLAPGKQLNLRPVIGTALGMSESSIDVIKNQLANMFSGGIHGKLPVMQIADKKSSDLFEFHAMTLPN